ncbi:porin family protein [Gammaproteobacteria bacterium]|nr:porin family protein [Gammaproteobacteria bacterium]
MIVGLLALGCMHSIGARADSATYIGLQYGVTTYEESGIPDLEAATGILRVGQYGDGVFDFEWRAGIGLSQSDEQNFGASSATVDVDIDSLLGIYLLARLGAPGSTSIYGVFGYSTMEATASATLGEFSASTTHRETGPSFGLGVNYDVRDSFLLNIEYISYVNGDDFSASAISLGILF